MALMNIYRNVSLERTCKMISLCRTDSSKFLLDVLFEISTYILWQRSPS